MTEYGRIHTDGSRSGGQPVVDAATCRGSWTLGTACGKCSRCVATEMTNENKYPSGGSGPGLQTVVIRKGMAACTDRIGGAGVVTHGVVGVVKDPAAEWHAGYEAGVEAAAKALEADARLCDCAALEDRECACGAWDGYKTIASARAVEIVNQLKDTK